MSLYRVKLIVILRTWNAVRNFAPIASCLLSNHRLIHLSAIEHVQENTNAKEVKKRVHDDQEKLHHVITSGFHPTNPADTR